jgi:hypothetical protein
MAMELILSNGWLWRRGGGAKKDYAYLLRKERKETKHRGHAPRISNSHGTTEYSPNINPYNDTPRTPRDVEPNNNREINSN